MMRERTRFWVLLFGASLFAVAIAGNASDDAQSIVTQCIEAMGGHEVIDGFRTLRLRIYWPDHGASLAEIERPNRSRIGVGVNVVFDGERAAILKPEAGRRYVCDMAVPKGDLVDFDVDIAWFVPAFLDYPATYLGREQLGTEHVDVLRVKLPFGAQMDYYISADTHFILRALASFTYDGEEMKVERTYRNHRSYGGVLFPSEFTYSGRTGDRLTARVLQVQINPFFPDGHFDTSACFENAEN